MQVSQILEKLEEQQDPIYLTEAFGPRAIQDMELALLKACERLPAELDNHECRTFIANRILRRVNDGERTCGGLITAALAAIDELKQSYEITAALRKDLHK